jgi:GNAT superfamily N-acetyltransferase
MTVSPSRVEWGTGTPPREFADAAPPGVASDAPSAAVTWAVSYANGAPAARLATWMRDSLQGVDGRCGLIGHYEARSRSAGVAALADALQRLRAAGCRTVLGPMNGSTWARYRFALPDAGLTEAPFLGEPVNPADYPQHFLEAGMLPVEHYESRIVRDIGTEQRSAEEADAAARERGIRITALDMDRFGQELEELHALSLRAFASNAFYSPIPLEQFAALYTPMRPMIDPGLVLLARAGSELAGYVFAYADPMAPGKGRPVRLVLKTLAVDPDWRRAGLGKLLVARLHDAARRKGLTSVIHALMQVQNASVRISVTSAEPFRRYALYGVTWP